MASLSGSAVAEGSPEPWLRIAGLRPRLRDHVQFYSHCYRGQPWSILADEFNESYFRCSPVTFRFLQQLDGHRTIEEAYQRCLSDYSESTASDNPENSNGDKSSSGFSNESIAGHDEVILLVASLKAADLLQGDFPVDVDDITGRHQKRRLRQRRQRWLRPFAVKIPLLDPDRFLSGTVSVVSLLFNVPVLLAWIAMVTAGTVLAGMHWPELVDHWQARFLDPQNLLWLWLLYPLVKGLHELGHAYATRVWGGAVHEMGLMLLVFMPVPYVDSSASHRFASKRQRMVVGAAGLMVELLLAALALLLWTLMDAGTVRDIAFNIAVIGGVSTLLFNGNPLLRFDGYYVLSDLIEIPNLAQRSNQYLGYLIKRYVLALADSRNPVTARGEAFWFVAYGICSGIYRLVISLSIALWISGKFFIVGVILALWAIFSMIFLPALGHLNRLLPQVVRAGKKARLAAVIIGTGLTVAVLLVLPVRHSFVVNGVIRLPEEAIIRTDTAGTVAEVAVRDGQSVEVDRVLLRLEDPIAQSRLQVLIAKREVLRAQQQEVFITDRTRSEILKNKALGIDAEITDVRRTLDQLVIRSPVAGTLSIPGLEDLPGRYLGKGDLLGYVVDLRRVSARVVVPQGHIDRLRSETSTIEVKLHSRPGETLKAEFIREIPKATDQLPSRLLGTQAGGEVAVDARDEAGVQALSNVFEVDIALPIKASGDYLGQRVLVRFEYGYESLGRRLYRPLRQFLFEKLLI